ncbi:IclR family transcriptional regulator [Spongiactinospora sp. TRM90649]|uniref:IclR family transcriptional regulator n=1 Tax=Spongiactinospora sp. TRM90649 TaxID=3031114 RepID=UPI0023F635A7|nr:IclR family transcriptional regulator [Spongiactinospora sp. TRM90649]MDF5752862.1 IclR family transcriptional regulator [Spongiactinospora sp. TRM90649]
MAGSKDSAAIVPSVARAVRILELLASAPDGLTLTEVARALDFPPSSALAICTTLRQSGLAHRTRERRYVLGPGVLALAEQYTRGRLPALFMRACRDVLPDNRETVVLAVREWHEVVYLAQRPGNRPLAVNYHLGMRLPAHTTASGKASLSTVSDDQVGEIYSVSRSAAEPDLGQLIEDLRKTRERGYAIDDEETAPGMVCLGVPIAAPGTSSASAAVAVSLVKSTVDDTVLSEYVHLMRTLADALSDAAPTTD